jgi:hypothetical protein
VKKLTFSVLLKAYDAASDGAEFPTIHVCGLEEYRKRQLCESGWPEGRPTWDEFWNNDLASLTRLKAALRGTT